MTWHQVLMWIFYDFLALFRLHLLLSSLLLLGELSLLAQLLLISPTSQPTTVQPK